MFFFTIYKQIDLYIHSVIPAFPGTSSSPEIVEVAIHFNINPIYHSYDFITLWIHGKCFLRKRTRDTSNLRMVISLVISRVGRVVLLSQHLSIAKISICPFFCVLHKFQIPKKITLFKGDPKPTLIPSRPS